MYHHKTHNIRQQNIDTDEIVEKIIKFNGLDFKEKFNLLNKKTNEFVNSCKDLSRSKFRKYYDMFISAKEKAESKKEKTHEIKKIYEETLLKAIVLVKYDINRKQIDKNLEILFETFIKKVKDKDEKEFIQAFENFVQFLEAIAAYLKNK